ncbi:hypothetical protein BV898_00594 [Hypsibius exemplaris]|uniref:Ninjurin-1 n=1 Tax=Hypsibius exemplaris TaxID=2072580 RepID=A0A1W0XE65_HYPEX|nr:hypothetical protein BV898_00594 [Hypsibius exemplaris]
MSVEPLENPDGPHANGVNGGISDRVAKHSHGRMLANMAHESANMPYHGHGHGAGQEKNGNGIAGAFVNVISPITDPLWYQGANAFATRKTVVTSLINIALITSTAGQLKSLMRINPSYPFYNSLLGMLIVCMLAQIGMGIMLFFIGRLNLNREEQRSRADLLQNIVLGTATIVLILHIMNTAFGIEDLGYLVPGYSLVPLPITARPSPTTPPYLFTGGTFAATPAIVPAAYTVLNHSAT